MPERAGKFTASPTVGSSGFKNAYYKLNSPEKFASSVSLDLHRYSLAFTEVMCSRPLSDPLNSDYNFIQPQGMFAEAIMKV